ncbi:NAD(P)-dependent oxidoreductase [Falsirhodobacter sp. 20TX0035]|uniref:NAD(P)-dependent oxidoreductase n=1 Tax=Falsirhodobacter sp. 20TX0035 TaxID=3022019 RepID=UPI00232BCEC4|nr:NAD(P)-dependent oxidoreductase [Falsirhodobacter sp. 20TX0035]MDB6454776.1 NAD(P)-dependent oxidoreductase [Falsirhodobacter sp. 20TX0035]
MTRRIAFLGNGLMGAPMARRLLATGHRVTVWNRATAKAEALVPDGATLATDPAQAVTGAEIVFTMLADGPAVASVLFEQGVAQALSREAVMIDTSSIAPMQARLHAQRLADLGVHYVDCPVSGGVVGAREGTLALMAGGDAAVIEGVTDVLSALGRVTHVGPSGAGQVCKLANQQIVAITIGAVAEAMILVSAGGADRARFREAIRGGFAESRILDLHGGRMVDRDFTPGGPSRLQLKDLDSATDLAATAGLTLPLTDTVRAAFRDFVASGHGDTDHSGLLLHLEAINHKDEP